MTGDSQHLRCFPAPASIRFCIGDIVSVTVGLYVPLEAGVAPAIT
jgi:hypothetical protein